jgi:uracil-DNA glycosylase family 4
VREYDGVDHEAALARQAPCAYTNLCTRCSLHKSVRSPLVVNGPVPARVMIILPNPGRDFWATPFGGSARGLLHATLQAVGIPLDDVFVTYATRCPADEVKNESISACRPWVEQEIEAVRPDVIVCCGDAAHKSLFGSGTKHKYKVAAGEGKKGQTLYREPKLGELRRRDDLVHEWFEEIGVPTYSHGACTGLEPELVTRRTPVLVAYSPDSALAQERYRSGFLRDLVRLSEHLGIVAADDSLRDYADMGAGTLPDALAACAKIHGGVVALDTEFDRDGRLFCYSFSWEEGLARVVLADSPIARPLLRYLLDSAAQVVFHSAQADVPVICNFLATSVDRFPWHKVEDTAVQAYVLGKRPIALKSLAENELGLRVIRLEDFIGEDYDFGTVNHDTLVRYAAADADYTLRLHNRFSAQLSAHS